MEEDTPNPVETDALGTGTEVVREWVGGGVPFQRVRGERIGEELWEVEPGR